jgi:hypothetical protein
MTPTEKRTWGSLISGILVFGWFIMKMTDGLSVVAYEGNALVSIFIGVIIASIIANIITASAAAMFFGHNKQDEDYMQDERDLAIERNADRIGFFAVTSLIAIVIMLLLLQDSSPSYRLGIENWHLRIEGSAGMFFVLMSSLFVGHLVRDSATILFYRRHAMAV